MGTILEVRGLCRSFGSHRTLRNLTFSINEGEVFGLVGPSGSGKTVTLRILSGSLEGDSGTVSIGGISLAARSRKAHELFGSVAENHPLPGWLTPFEYLRLRVRLKDVRDGRRELSRVLQTYGLLPYGKRYRIGQLSSGHRRLVALADADLAMPPLLLLDGLEPWQVRVALEGRPNSPAVLLTGRSAPELEAICQKFIFLDRGSATVCGEGGRAA
ncbi:MAG: ABC transporter ATP-binding protein [Puniceicoccales bacterium]|jgi:ABC-2 type transport system ATP-binding protein|nr:ABC transporter ATP-binding protein [Puniceicoccales bacterium]